MPLLTWNETMSVGVKAFDADHQRIIAMVNELHQAMTDGFAQDVLSKIFDDMMRYMNIHFDREERLFKQTGYPEAAQQHEMHIEMGQRVLEAKKKFDGSSTSLLPMEVMYILRDWWIDHIQNEDKKYTAFLNAHGIF
jgi:hemerythrin